MEPGPINKGMHSNIQKNSRKGQKRVKYLKIWE